MGEQKANHQPHYQSVQSKTQFFQQFRCTSFVKWQPQRNLHSHTAQLHILPFIISLGWSWQSRFDVLRNALQPSLDRPQLRSALLFSIGTALREGDFERLRIIEGEVAVRLSQEDDRATSLVGNTQLGRPRDAKGVSVGTSRSAIVKDAIKLTVIAIRSSMNNATKLYLHSLCTSFVDCWRYLNNQNCTVCLGVLCQH